MHTSEKRTRLREPANWKDPIVRNKYRNDPALWRHG